MTQRHTRLGQRRTLILVSAAGLALTGTVAFARWFQAQWQGDPYPVVDPAATARRLDGRTQAVYDALGLPEAVLAADWPGAGLDTDGDTCPRPGLRHFSDGLIDSPPSEPHTVEVTDTWALKDVSRAQAAPAMLRVRDVLTGQGWKLAAYVDSPDDLRMRLRPPGTGDVVAVEAYPQGRLQVSAYASCARYPQDTRLSTSDQPALPAPQAPAQLRR